MIKIETKNCKDCLFRSYLANLEDDDGHICLATRIGESVGSNVALPTVLPNKFVPNVLGRGQEVPDSPDWCPLRFNAIIIGLTGTIPEDLGEVGNLWPEDLMDSIQKGDSE